jgi:serine O-acetyltransferase
VKILLIYLCRPINTVFIYTNTIGPGLFIQHGFSTIISAKSIGKDCWINQQVTIGYSNVTDCPTIGDNVTIHAGAKVIGKVTIGNNARV